MKGWVWRDWLLFANAAANKPNHFPMNSTTDVTDSAIFSMT